MIDVTEHQKSIDQFATVITMVVKRIENVATEMKATLAHAQARGSEKDTKTEELQFAQLSEQMARLESLINNASSQPSGLSSTAERTLKALSATVQEALSSVSGSDQIVERIEQLGSAQRTAFTRIETAMSKAVSGLEPALDHLNARAADTENMMSDWHKDLKTLSLHTRAIADTTVNCPPPSPICKKTSPIWATSLPRFLT